MVKPRIGRLMESVPCSISPSSAPRTVPLSALTGNSCPKVWRRGSAFPGPAWKGCLGFEPSLICKANAELGNVTLSSATRGQARARPYLTSWEAFPVRTQVAVCVCVKVGPWRGVSLLLCAPSPVVSSTTSYGNLPARCKRRRLS